MDKKGTTLIDVLLALFLLGITIQITFTLLPQIHRISSISSSSYEISRVAQSILEEIKSLNASNEELDKLALQELLDHETILYIDGYEGKLKIYPVVEEKNLYRINLQIRNPENNYQYTLNSYFNRNEQISIDSEGYLEPPIDLVNFSEE